MSLDDFEFQLLGAEGFECMGVEHGETDALVPALARWFE
jgi:hypothetical protein